MHYLILKWNKETRQYDIIHYTHSFDDMQRMLQKYPEMQEYIHLIDLKYLKSHEVMEFVRGLRKEMPK